MRKTLFIISVILFPLIMLSALDVNSERVWYYSDTGSYNVSKIDLNKAYYPPKYDTEYIKTKNDGNSATGTYAAQTNVIGNVGCAYTDHRIKFTVTTSGRFVSVKDPTKYREFYLALKPRIRYVPPINNDDSNFNCYSHFDENRGEYVYKTYSDLGTTVPTTRTGLAEIISPALPKYGNNNKSKIIIDNNECYVARYYFDLCVCMDPLTSEDLTHLIESDDYIATVTISWSCMEDNCSRDPDDGNDCHYGSFTFAINGYYGNKSSSSAVFLSVTPTASSMNLDLATIATENPSGDVLIADLQLYTLTRKGSELKNPDKEESDWVEKLTLFVSASPGYMDTNSLGFRLTNSSLDNNYYIPFKVVVKDRNLVTKVENSVSGNATKSFDGTSGYSTTMSETEKITITQNEMANKQGATAYSVAYGANVYIRFVESGHEIYAYNGDDDTTGLLLKDVNNENMAIAISTAAQLAGIYTSKIYYHVVSNY